MRISSASIPKTIWKNLGKIAPISILAKADKKTANFIKAFFF